MSDIWRSEEDIAAFAYRLQVRRAAHAVSRIYAPGAILAVVVWLCYNMTACWGGEPLAIVYFLCRHSNILLYASAVLLFGGEAWLVFVFGRTRSAMSHAENARATASPSPGAAATSSRGERAWKIDPENLRRTVWFAFEMSLWATLTLFATLLFYQLEWDFVYGAIVLLAMVRVVAAVLRWWIGPRTPDSTPAPITGPIRPLGPAPSPARADEERGQAIAT